MDSNEDTADHIAQNVATYDSIAEHYKVTATPELRAWKEASIRRFADFLPGQRVLVPGCGDGRDSRFLSSIGLRVTSFDLSEGMLRQAKAQDPDGTYLRLDFRDISSLEGSFDGIWASGCLYHLTKPEFAVCVKCCWEKLAAKGAFYLSVKEGKGERYEETPGPRYPGGAQAKALLRGRRFYAYYERQELMRMLTGFALLHEQRVLPAEGASSYGCARRVLGDSNA